MRGGSDPCSVTRCLRGPGRYQTGRSYGNDPGPEGDRAAQRGPIRVSRTNRPSPVQFDGDLQPILGQPSARPSPHSTAVTDWPVLGVQIEVVDLRGTPSR